MFIRLTDGNICISAVYKVCENSMKDSKDRHESSVRPVSKVTPNINEVIKSSIW
jgi:hypothetical protein